MGTTAYGGKWSKGRARQYTKATCQNPPFRWPTSAEFSEVFCRIVGFLDSAEMFHRFVGFLYFGVAVG